VSDLTPETLEPRTREWLQVAIEAVCSSGEDADTTELVMADAGTYITFLEARVEALESKLGSAMQALIQAGLREQVAELDRKRIEALEKEKR